MSPTPPTGPPADARRRWHDAPAGEAVRKLGADLERGLATAEVEGRRERFGPNLLDDSRKTPWQRVLLRQFTDTLILILAAAGAVALAIGEVTGAATIFAIVALNGVLGFTQEWRAEQAIRALRRMLTPRCRALRDGAEREIEAEGLVPGDVVILEVGDRVPADLRLVRSINLKADESVLTGEPGSVAKETEPVRADAVLAERSCMAWMGTAITNGRARGIVVATGMTTEFGRIAALTQAVEEEQTPLQKRLATLGRQIGVVAVAISATVAGIGWLTGKPPFEMFLTGVALAVAIVPSGLPAVVTVTLALGIHAMVRRRALLRHLQAAETLGCATLVCTDKTGTLTHNEMTVTRIWLPAGGVDVTGTGYDPAGHFRVGGERLDCRQRPDLLDLLQTGLICNHASLAHHEGGWTALGEPTEAALVVVAYKAWLTPGDGHDTLSEFSFDPIRKRMTVVVHRPEGMRAHVKGAPEVVLERCSRIRDGDRVRPLTDADREAFDRAYLAMAGDGLRALALAHRELPPGVPLDAEAVERDLVLLGVVGIIDPPREEVPEAIETARAAGVRTLMITGDAAPTALAVARRIGLPARRAITGREIDAMSDGELRGRLEEEVLFARTTPLHKLRIVGVLQDLGHVVGMTGDGVNDAPALKRADIGIAMGLRGTEVARAASDMILTDDNFASIVNAIEEGRRQYDNVRKSVRYLLSSNAAEVLAIFLNVLLGGPLILLPVQLLWINLVTDGMTAVALGAEQPERDVMRRAPRPQRENVVDRSGALSIAAFGGYMGLATLWFFHDALQSDPAAVAAAQTAAFTGLVVLEKMNVFNFRALGAPLHTVGFFSNPWLLLAWVTTVALQGAAVYSPFLQAALHTVPLGWDDWGRILVVAAPIFLGVEAFKLLRGWRRAGR